MYGVKSSEAVSVQLLPTSRPDCCVVARRVDRGAERGNRWRRGPLKTEQTTPRISPRQTCHGAQTQHRPPAAGGLERLLADLRTVKGKITAHGWPMPGTAGNVSRPGLCLFMASGRPGQLASRRRCPEPASLRQRLRSAAGYWMISYTRDMQGPKASPSNP